MRSPQVGRCGQTEEQLQQNVLSAVAILRQKFPGGMRNIRSLHLKLGKSPAVPIFVSDGKAHRAQGYQGKCDLVEGEYDVKFFF